jgi:hypothetical protein
LNFKKTAKKNLKSAFSLWFKARRVERVWGKIYMKKHEWEKAWEDKKFEIKTLTPSILVSEYAKKTSPA